MTKMMGKTYFDQLYPTAQGYLLSRKFFFLWNHGLLQLK